MHAIVGKIRVSRGPTQSNGWRELRTVADRSSSYIALGLTTPEEHRVSTPARVFGWMVADVDVK